MDQIARDRLPASAFGRTLLAAVCLSLTVGRAAAQSKPPAAGIIDGLVTDTSLVALSQASVSMFGSTVKVETGADGRFRVLQVPAGDYIMIVKRVGFRPASSVIAVRDNEEARVTFSLERVPPELDTVRVTTRHMSGRLADFEERRKNNVGGQFLTQDDIERRHVAYATELIVPMLGVQMRVTPGGGGQYKKIAMNRRAGVLACPYQVLVDGIPMPEAFDLDLLPPPSTYAAVEVYIGAATLPPSLGATSGRWCGVIAVWTKEGS